jgi:hypothetical protein
MKKQIYLPNVPTGSSLKSISRMTPYVLEESWSDILDDDEYISNGIAALYRNPNSLQIFDNLPEYTFLFHDYTNSEYSKNLFDTKPVAFGITAYLGYDLSSLGPSLKEMLSEGKTFDTKDLFKNYLSNASKRVHLANKSLPFPKTDDEVNHQFYFDHLADEKLKLADSHIFYTQCKNDADFNLKSKIKIYVDAYFDWIENLSKELDPASRHDPLLNSGNDRNNVNSNTTPNIVGWHYAIALVLLQQSGALTSTIGKKQQTIDQAIELFKIDDKSAANVYHYTKKMKDTFHNSHWDINFFLKNYGPIYRDGYKSIVQRLLGGNESAISLLSKLTD